MWKKDDARKWIAHNKDVGYSENFAEANMYWSGGGVTSRKTYPRIYQAWKSLTEAVGKSVGGGE